MSNTGKSNAPLRHSGGSSWTLKAGVAALVSVILYYVLAGRDQSTLGHPSVTIKQGTVVGRLVDDGTFPEPLEGFMGIPYALPPVDQRRFREAIPVPPGNLTQKAFYLGPRSEILILCIQSLLTALQMPRQTTCAVPRRRCTGS